MSLIDLWHSIRADEKMWLLVILLTIVQITPIKFNPWTSIVKFIGRALNTEVIEKLDLNEATTARYRIIRFADEVRYGEKHSEEHYNQILEDIDEYERYCLTHPTYENSKAVSAIASIRDSYNIAKKNKAFLA